MCSRAQQQAKQINDSAHGAQGSEGTGTTHKAITLSKRQGCYTKQPHRLETHRAAGCVMGGRLWEDGAPEPAMQRSEGSIADEGNSQCKGPEAQTRDPSREQEEGS